MGVYLDGEGPENFDLRTEQTVLTFDMPALPATHKVMGIVKIGGSAANKLAGACTLTLRMTDGGVECFNSTVQFANVLDVKRRRIPFYATVTGSAQVKLLLTSSAAGDTAVAVTTVLDSDDTAYMLANVAQPFSGLVSDSLVDMLGVIQTIVETNGVSLADGAITAAKFDETTAFPLTLADTGVSAVARTGECEHTLHDVYEAIQDIAAGSAPLNAVAQDATVTEGEQTNSYLDTKSNTTTYHQIADDSVNTGKIDFEYTFTPGINAVPIGMTVTGRLDSDAVPGGTDTIQLYAWDWTGAGAWEQISGPTGDFKNVKNSTAANDVTKNVILFPRFINGSGTVKIRFAGTGLDATAVMYVRFIFIGYVATRLGLTDAALDDVNAEADAALADYDGPTDAEMAAAIATVISAAAGLPVHRTVPSYTAAGGTVINLSAPEDGAAAFTVTLYDADGDLVDLTSVLLRWAVIDFAGSRTDLGNGDGETGVTVLSPPTAGVVQLTLTPTETATAGAGRHELWDVTDAANPILYALGSLVIKATQGPTEEA